MNLEKPYQIAEILASVAIVISLAYVAVQVRQNTQAMEHASGNYATDQVRKLYQVSSSAEHRALLFRGWPDPDSLVGVEKFHFFGIMHEYFRTLENVYYQRVDGVLDSRLWDGLRRSIGSALALPGTRMYWRERQDWYSDDFRSFVDTTMDEFPENAYPLAGTQAK